MSSCAAVDSTILRRIPADGQAITGVTVVNDSELRFVPGSRAAGEYEFEVPNNLGYARSTAELRVADPPNYGNFNLPAAIGLQERIVSSPINAIVIASSCYFCGDFGSPTAGTLQRFAYDAGSQTWSRTQHAYPSFYDFAFSPDESELLVLTHDNLLIVDPATMTTLESHPLTSFFGGSGRQLAVLNNGLVLIDGLLQKVFSLHAREFVPYAAAVGGNAETSRDGSRAIFGQAVNSGDVPYRYHNASDGSVFTSQTNLHYARGIYSRHAQTAFANHYVVNSDLEEIGTLPVQSHWGDLSPDGTRAYGLDFNTSTLRTFDLTGPTPFAEIPPALAIPGIGASGGRVATDPSGGAVFVLTESTFQVIDLP